MFQILKQRLQTLGYELMRNQTDNLGRTWPYRTSPCRSGGPTNYFLTLNQVKVYADQVSQVRNWQEFWTSKTTG